MQVRNVRTDFDDFAGKFVADDQGDANCRLGPVVPVIDMHVGAADACAQDAYLDIVDARLGLGDVFKPQAGGFAALD
jgi:hypothetical protein